MSDKGAAQPAGAAGVVEGVGVVATQTKLLAVKNVKLHLRSRVSTATQLCVGVVFLVLVRLMELAVNSEIAPNARDVRTPSTAAIRGVRACDARARGGGGACYVLAYAPDAASGGALGDYAEAIVADVLADAGQPAIGAAGGAIGFADAKAMAEWMFDNPATVDVGVVFRAAPSAAGGGTFAYSLQANWTVTCAALDFLDCNDPKVDVALPMQARTEARRDRAPTPPPPPPRLFRDEC